MKKFWLGLAASCVVLLASSSVQADHRHHRGGCGYGGSVYGGSVYGGSVYGGSYYGRSPYGGRVQVYSPGAIYRAPVGGYQNYQPLLRPSFSYPGGYYGSPGYGYGRGGVGFYFGF